MCAVNIMLGNFDSELANVKWRTSGHFDLWLDQVLDRWTYQLNKFLKNSFSTRIYFTCSAKQLRLVVLFQIGKHLCNEKYNNKVENH